MHFWAKQDLVLTSSDELGCRVNVRLGGRGGEEVGGLKNVLQKKTDKEQTMTVPKQICLSNATFVKTTNEILARLLTSFKALSIYC